jgi:hypothetical protein
MRRGWVVSYCARRNLEGERPREPGARDAQGQRQRSDSLTSCRTPAPVLPAARGDARPPSLISLCTAPVLLLVLFALPALCAEVHVAQYCVAPYGDDAASGSREFPLGSVSEALKRIAKDPRRGVEPLTVWIQDGRYWIDRTLVIDSSLSGTAEAPVTLAGMPGGKVYFDGGIGLDPGFVGLNPSSVGLVTDEVVLQRLAPDARGRVLSVRCTDPEVKRRLANPAVRMSADGRMLTLARYPNVGYAHIDRILDKGAVYAHGRTKGAPPRSSRETPIGGVFTIRDKDTSAWEREIGAGRRAFLTGYLSYDWYKERHPVASIEEGRVRLVDYSRYGILNIQKIPRRLYVSNLLCELDSPGEFFYDEASSRLYLETFGGGRPPVGITIWSGPPFAHFKGASHVRLENVVVEGVGRGKAAVVIEGGNDVRVAGCTVRNCSRPAVAIEGGRNNGIKGCDIYDVPHHLTLSGGEVGTLTAAGNYAENCHFTQWQAQDYYGRIQLRGVGNIFRNNLVHNFIGQVMTVGGCEHRIERNEFFNIGVEEGDGGTIYSGAQMWSWGNVYRHNLLHHLMCVPQAHPRGGIYPDDHDAGDTITENIFYKAAHRAVLLNGGAGHTVSSNLFLNGHIGIYNTVVYGDRAWKNIADFESGKQKRGDKGDHIWRTEQVVGKEGWNSEPWLSRHPLFAKIMNQERLRFWPIECRFTDNLFCGNDTDILIGKDFHGGRLKVVGNPHIKVTGSRTVGMQVFRDPSCLDFSAKETGAHGLPEIPFDRIGLYKDWFRPVPPDSARYRRLARERFEGRLSYDPKARYDAKTINDLLYWNSGDAILVGEGF